MVKKSPPKIIGITIGDPCGIGPEVTAKALRNAAVRKLAHFKIIGDEVLFKKYRFPRTPTCQWIGINKIHPFDFPFKDDQSEAGAAALAYLETAVGMLKDHSIQGLITAPVSKEAISRLGIIFNGHTEYLADAFNVQNFEMMFVAPDTNVIIATRHLPLREVSQDISQEGILRTIRMGDRTLKNLFRIKKPKIAVLGLNPHAGEGGLLGTEEIEIISPAIAAAKAQGIIVTGPYPADTLFRKNKLQQFDLVIAMYHDQGLAPIKGMYFDQLVNVTIGLPFVRTSPAHGTANDIAGKNKANPNSMIEAIKLCAKLVNPGKSI